VSSVTVTLELLDRPFGRLVVEALVAKLLRTGRAEVDEARRWLSLGDAPGAMDAFLRAHGITAEGAGGDDGA
jgi:hypothetical protein